MDPGRFASAGVHWGVSVFLLQPNLRGRLHFSRAVRPLGLASFLAGVSGSLLLWVVLGQNFGTVLCYFWRGKCCPFLALMFFRGSTSAIFRFFFVLLISGFRFWRNALQSNLSDLLLEFRQPRIQASAKFYRGKCCPFSSVFSVVFFSSSFDDLDQFVLE